MDILATGWLLVVSGYVCWIKRTTLSFLADPTPTVPHISVD